MLPKTILLNSSTKSKDSCPSLLSLPSKTLVLQIHNNPPIQKPDSNSYKFKSFKFIIKRELLILDDDSEYTTFNNNMYKLYQKYEMILRCHAGYSNSPIHITSK